MKSLKKHIAILNLLALLLTVAVNYLSSSGVLSGVTIKDISARYHNHFTPAGYAFSIWGLIYIGLLGFVCYSVAGRGRTHVRSILEKIGWLFVLSCLANSFWVMAWLNDYVGLSVIIMAALLTVLIAIIARTRMELDAHPLKEYVFIYWPFAVYAGWITVALIANISAYLTKTGWGGWGIPGAHWAIAMIIVAGLVNVTMVVTRNLREFAAVGVWALFAISVANHHQGSGPIRYACYITIIVLLAFIIGNGARSSKRSVHGM